MDNFHLAPDDDEAPPFPCRLGAIDAHLPCNSLYCSPVIAAATSVRSESALLAPYLKDDAVDLGNDRMDADPLVPLMEYQV